MCFYIKIIGRNNALDLNLIQKIIGYSVLDRWSQTEAYSYCRGYRGSLVPIALKLFQLSVLSGRDEAFYILYILIILPINYKSSGPHED